MPGKPFELPAECLPPDVCDPNEVIAAVAKRWGEPVEDIVGKCRRTRVWHARAAAVYAVRRLCGHLTFPEIGTYFSNRHYSTIRHLDAVARFRPTQVARLSNARRRRA